jgi:asparagine synthase (glutamine-hydrolysing)
VSYYSDSEPNWNERPYFTQVEEKRGRTGLHLDFSAQGSVRLEFDSDRFAATPSAGVRASKAADHFAAHLTSQGYRVLLSGIAGDEILGGVPTPTPELADSLARVRWRDLARQLKAWALRDRMPWHLLLFETAKAFAPTVLAGMSSERSLPPWLRPDFVRHHRTALQGFVPRMTVFGPLPSLQQNLTTLEFLRRRVGCFSSHAKPPYEKRYPYLDRDLLEFAYAIPREQILRPGQRRSLMRRALAGIVPEQILARRRKAFVVRAPLAALATNWNDLSELSRRMVSGSLGIVDAPSFGQALRKARHGEQVAIVSVMRTLCVEFWLQNLLHWNCLSVAGSASAAA